MKSIVLLIVPVTTGLGGLAYLLLAAIDKIFKPKWLQPKIPDYSMKYDR